MELKRNLETATLFFCFFFFLGYLWILIITALVFALLTFITHVR